MNVGELRHKIIIQQRINNKDENGRPITSYTDFATVWAAKRGLSGREYYAAAAIQSEMDVVYTIRYDSKTSCVTTGMRIIDDEKYDIKSIVDKDGKRTWLEIRARRI